MGRLLDSLTDHHPAFSKVDRADGIYLVRRDGQSDTFNAIARDLQDHSGDDYVVFLTSDGTGGYEQALVVPL